MNRNLYYFHKDSGLEIDFVTRYKGKCTLIEVKAENGKAKSLNTVLGDYEHYHVDSAIKIRVSHKGRRKSFKAIYSKIKHNIWYSCYILMLYVELYAFIHSLISSKSV